MTRASGDLPLPIPDLDRTVVDGTQDLSSRANRMPERQAPLPMQADELQPMVGDGLGGDGDRGMRALADVPADLDEVQVDGAGVDACGSRTAPMPRTGRAA